MTQEMAEEFEHPGHPKDWPQIQAMRRIWRAAALLRHLHQPHFERVGLPMVEFDLLAALGNTSGMRMKELAEAMVTAPPNVTRVCGVMEEKGLVQRRRSTESDREVVASLTPAGEALFRELFSQTVNYSARILDSALSEEELKSCARLLDKLLRSVKSPDSAAGPVKRRP